MRKFQTTFYSENFRKQNDFRDSMMPFVVMLTLNKKKMDLLDETFMLCNTIESNRLFGVKNFINNVLLVGAMS